MLSFESFLLFFDDGLTVCEGDELLTSKRRDRKNKDETLLIKFKSTHLLLDVDLFPLWDFTPSDSQIIPDTIEKRHNSA